MKHGRIHRKNSAYFPNLHKTIIAEEARSVNPDRRFFCPKKCTIWNTPAAHGFPYLSETMRIVPLIVDIQNDLALLDSMSLLDPLLEDRTTGKSILWATDAYAERGRQYEKDSRITRESLIPEGILRTRAQKESAQQDARTRQHAEVFTPLWVVCKMNDYADEEWFGYPDVFFKDGKPVPDKIRFWDNRKTWKDYVDSRRLEITCGEAPFLVTRYDVETGEILPVQERAGILDRKLRVVGENTDNAQAWITWAARAVEATYGYEFQGDSLLIARLNVLMTVRDFMEDRFGQTLTEIQFGRLIQTVVWNLWQMDGLTDRIPLASDEEPDMGGLLFGLMQEQENTDCRIYDWRTGLDVPFYRLKEDLYKVGEKSMKFDFIIGNPPYQIETESESTRMPPVYNYFMDEAYKVASSVILITPARFLFNTGFTPKAWNEKMLNDPHFHVLFYEPDSSKIFTNTDIKGGVIVSVRDEKIIYGAIGTFTKYPELNTIMNKTKSVSSEYMDGIIYSNLSFGLSDILAIENPDLVDRLRTNAFTALSSVFYDNAPNDGREYIRMHGLLNMKRVVRFIRRDYIKDSSGTIDCYTLLLPSVNGAGQFGEQLSDSLIAAPGEGYTQTYIGIGAFSNLGGAENAQKYIKTKYARCMLGVLKTTQHCSGPRWAWVPLQDFTPSSDIDWSKSISEIDRQLYAKYSLDESEIEFIETHVKEMT